jgi:muramidase (phage lysozyme)
MVRKHIRRRTNSLKRKIKKHLFYKPLFVAIFLLGIFSYAGYMEPRTSRVDPNSYIPLLNLIAQAESSGNYNAHFGNSQNDKIKFTEMTVAEVLAWQDRFVAQGNPSSAVGRYQIINSTLSDLVTHLGIKPTQKFDPSTQDKMAIALLERRGAERYANKQLSKNEFAANLAKEWAALPQITGSNPDQSYYAADGLNKSSVRVDDIKRAIEPIQNLD